MGQPDWELFKDGTNTPVNWSSHGPNERFAIYAAGGPGLPLLDVVWDKETDLVWPRNAKSCGGAVSWLDANTAARALVLANRSAWRLPTVEELASLIDTRRSNPALPTGHPFLDVQFGETAPAYWTSTNYENFSAVPPGVAWFVNMGSGGSGTLGKNQNGFVWPVRGGRGGVNWNL